MKNDKDERPFLSKINDNVKIAFLRFWFVGLIYYLIGWGTDLGMRSDPLDLIFVLAIVIAGGHIILFNPITRLMFDIERNGKVINKEIAQRKIWQGVLLNILEFFKCLFISFLIYLTYEIINMGLMNIFNLDNIPVQGEPILYGIFFALYYELISYIRNKVLLLWEKRKKKGE